MSDAEHVILPTSLLNRLLCVVYARYPGKSFGYLTSPSAGSRSPNGYVLFEDNIRNVVEWRGEFENRGRYFVDHSDAGFVATPEESLRVHKYLSGRALTEVAMFHTHRRHPGNFSEIDYDLHISRFVSLWHLIISLRNPRFPQLRAFDVAPSGVAEMEVKVVPSWTPEPTM